MKTWKQEKFTDLPQIIQQIKQRIQDKLFPPDPLPVRMAISVSCVQTWPGPSLHRLIPSGTRPGVGHLNSFGIYEKLWGEMDNLCPLDKHPGYTIG